MAEPTAPLRRRSKPKPKPKAKAKPQARARARRRAHTRGGVLWIAVSGVLLVGVVFVNVASLRLNLELDKAGQQRAKLRAETATLQSALSSALASPRIQKQARQEEGLVQADQVSIGYINLGG